MSTVPFLAGALLTGGLIAAVGPQNLHVVRSGLAREHVVPTVALCIAADALLIGLGLGGVSAALLASPAWLDAVRWVAAPALGWLAWQALREAVSRSARTGAPSLTGAAAARSAWPAALGRAAAVTFGNPAVWIETLLIVGAAGAFLPAIERVAFGAGAVAASTIWFCTLGFGARAAARWLDHPGVRRLLAAMSALALAATAWQLVAASPDAMPPRMPLAMSAARPDLPASPEPMTRATHGPRPAATGV